MNENYTFPRLWRSFLLLFAHWEWSDDLQCWALLLPFRHWPIATVDHDGDYMVWTLSRHPHLRFVGGIAGKLRCTERVRAGKARAEQILRQPK